MLLDQYDENIETIDTVKFKNMLIMATDVLKDAENTINDLNVFPVPDGDTGTNMYLTFSNAVDEIKDLEVDSVAKIADQLANGALMSARGNSGVILSQLLRGLAEGIANNKALTTKELANGLKKAADKAYQAVMKPVEGTILTVAREVGERAVEFAEDEDNHVKLLAEVIKTAEKSVENTPELLDALKEAGVVDAGGKGYYFILTGLLQGLVSAPKDFKTTKGKTSTANKKRKTEASETEFGYCTEFIVKGVEGINESEFRELISSFGDSLVVVKSKDIIKVHIHSEHPGEVLEKGLEYGQLTKIKIDNMSEQHEEIIREEYKSDLDKKEAESEEIDKKIAVLAVVAGKGLKNIFEGFGADYVIEGGQSMNPSTQDLLEGIEQIKADKIIILPNNKNVISAAEQTKELTDKTIKVVPTKLVPQGVAAMMMYNPEGEIEDVFENMKDEIEYVKTGEITYATRDTNVNDLEINEGDILGLIDGDIKLTSSDYNQAAMDTLEVMTEKDDSLITVYAGEDISDEDKSELKQKLKKEYNDFDVEVYDGQQPIYYYIISVE